MTTEAGWRHQTRPKQVGHLRGHRHGHTGMHCLLSAPNSIPLCHSPLPPQPSPYTSLLSECPHASLAGAEGAPSVTWHHFALDSTVFTLLYVYVSQPRGMKRHHWAYRCKLRLSIWAQYATLGATCTMLVCVRICFSGSLSVNQSLLTYNQGVEGRRTER